MINLLSQDRKANIRAARLNVILRRYVFGLILTILAMIAAFGIGYAFTIMQRNAATAEREKNEQAVAQYSKVASEAKAFADNLTSAKAILSNEVLFSKLMTDIAKTMPRGSVLTNLSVTTTDIGGKPINLSARTMDAGATPLKIKSELEASPLFENVSINSISKNPPSDEDPIIARKYPVTVDLYVTLSRGAGSHEVNP